MLATGLTGRWVGVLERGCTGADASVRECVSAGAHDRAHVRACVCACLPACMPASCVPACQRAC
eukprot:15207007-Alexandrium_andersonii.AAC.1